MFGWLKKFLEWPEGGVKNISDLGSYLKSYWWKLLIFLLALVILVWVIVKILKMIISLIKGK